MTQVAGDGMLPEYRIAEAVERIAAAFERIATALEAPAVQAVPAPEPPTTCPHPERMRVTFGSPDEWECFNVFESARCGYRSPALVASGG